MRRSLYAIAILLLTLASCGRKEDIIQGREDWLTLKLHITPASLDGAALERPQTTFRVVDDEGEDDLLSPLADGSFQAPHMIARSGARYAVFSPESLDASWDGDKLTFTFPAIQKAGGEETVPSAYAIYTGTGAGPAISIKPAFCGLRLRLGRGDIYRITFSGNWREYKLETSIGVMDPDEVNTLLLPVMDLAEGFSLKVECAEGSYTVSFPQPWAAAEGEIRTVEVPDSLTPELPEFIEIPDPVFKSYLTGLCDKDSDGEITPEEASTLTSINVSTESIGSMEGIRYFTSLTSIVAVGSRAADRTILGKLTALDLRGLQKLESLDCRHNHITTLTLGDNESLRSITCYGNSLTALNLGEAPMLESIDAGDCEIASASLEYNMLLTKLNIHNNRLTKLSLSGNPRLTTLTCDRNLLTSLDVSACTSLSSLDCSPMNDASGANLLSTLTVASGASISGVTVNRSSNYIPDGTSIVYATAPQTSLKTGLRSLYINTPDSRSITSKEEWTENCWIKLVDDEGTVYYENSQVGVKGRGNSTWNYDKKPYTLKLPEKADLLGTGEDKRWVLLANWMDRTLLRNDVSFELARRTSLEWTPSGEFIELYFNGKHQGNYWLGEKLKTGKSRLQADFLIEMDTYYDATWRFYSNYGFRVNQNQYGMPIGVKEPDDEKMTSALLAELKALVDGAESAIYNGGDYSAKINVRSFIDWYLVHEVTYNGEPNHPKSCYFYFRDGVMYAGPVWDFDWYTFQSQSGLFIPNSIYYAKLMADKAFVSALKQRWAELKPAFSGITSYIDASAARIKVSETINHSLWPIYSSYVNGDENMSFDQAVTRMKNGVTTRISAIDSALSKL